MSFPKIAIPLLLTLFWSALAMSAPKIETWTTEGGAKVLFLKTPGLPMVDVEVAFAAGSAWDGGKAGLAALTAAMLEKGGAGKWSADEIAQRLEEVGTHLSTGASRDMAWLTFRTLTRKEALSTTLETVAALLSSPRFEARDLEREKARWLLMLKRREESPSSLAETLFYKTLYGDHPYALPVEGEIETVQKLTREDLLAFHRRYYVARNGLIAIVGDVSREAATEIAETLMGQLPSGEPAPPIPEVEEVTPKQVWRDFPSSQAHIRVGMPLLKRGDPDYIPLYVANHVLGGGGFTSRIVKEIREERGWAYSAYSFLNPLKEKGPFVAGLQTRSDQAREALELLRKVIARFREEGPTEEELQLAKKNIVGGFPLRYDSNAKLLGYLVVIGYYNLPLDYLEWFPKRVEEVTAEEVREVFRRRFDPEKLSSVVVGPKGSAAAQ